MTVFGFSTGRNFLLCFPLCLLFDQDSTQLHSNIVQNNREQPENGYFVIKMSLSVIPRTTTPNTSFPYRPDCCCWDFIVVGIFRVVTRWCVFPLLCGKFPSSVVVVVFSVTAAADCRQINGEISHTAVYLWRWHETVTRLGKISQKLALGFSSCGTQGVCCDRL